MDYSSDYLKVQWITVCVRVIVSFNISFLFSEVLVEFSFSFKAISMDLISHLREVPAEFCFKFGYRLSGS